MRIFVRGVGEGRGLGSGILSGKNGGSRSESGLERRSSSSGPVFLPIAISHKNRMAGESTYWRNRLKIQRAPPASEALCIFNLFLMFV